ncbi:MAG: amidohydrolase family protein [Boseongicola sp. SB0664_bin_43]|uniref:Amidohydrolase family protein n=1 Tax=Boseongicola sp. SB0664_bin_43 TaxID=2604844 RepID=A0A6B0Y0H5_9RHOB|nr:amidohydrolase family protein [Boseongicola sp. SB0664_bin_43]MYK31592.1 amidohydrolase family protein [Boseongicola sp. SB0670_bin_30]
MNTEFTHVLLNGRTVALSLHQGRIAAIEPRPEPARHVAIPLPVDPHVHLDKTFTAGRCKSSKPGLFGAIDAMETDMANWSEEDLRFRMGRALKEASDNGICALRSHVDWPGPQTPLAWHVLGELAQDWCRRVHVQRASLTPLDLLGDPDHGSRIAERVASDGEVLGCFVYRNSRIEEWLEQVFALAARHGLRLDFHVDEGLEAEANAFDRIVALTARHRLAGRVLCGHACSLSIRPEREVARAAGAAAEAGVALVVLPTANLWLQDSSYDRTPRMRGLAPVHEMRAAGVSVLFGSDNVADPFYPFGSYDAVEVLRLASVSAQFDPAGWLDSITTRPTEALGLDRPELVVGGRADFLLIEGCDWNEALRSPRARRQVVRTGEIEQDDRVAA